MFDRLDRVPGAGSTTARAAGSPDLAEPAGVDPAAVRSWVSRLGADPAVTTDAGRVALIAGLEALKATAAGAQAVLAADLDASVRAREAAAGVPAQRRGRGVGAQVALARRESPHRGGQHLGLAKALVGEMPHTLGQLRAGRLSEWRATLLVRETACLSAEHRGQVDETLAADPATLRGVGDRAVAARAKALAYRLNPTAVVARVAQAESQRRVTLRPAPDCMARLSALLPVTQGVAAYAALARAADTVRATGDPAAGEGARARSRGQVMADTLVQRVTGQATADAVPVAVRLVMTDRALLGAPAASETAATDTTTDAARHDAALLAGPGPDPAPVPLPAGLGRRLVAGAPARVWLRRLFTDPQTGELVGMDARSRLFPGALRELITLRDQTCRTPWCDAPVRHGDHAVPAAAGGTTDAGNGLGLCEACNYVKEQPGWAAAPAPGSRPGRHRVRITTPTGHTHTSRPPPMPGAA